MTTRAIHLAALTEGVSSRSLTIGVVGLGYVGLAVAVAFAEAGFRVVGVDVDPERIRLIAAGESPIAGDEPGLDRALMAVVSSGNLTATSDHGFLTEASIVTINVQTPLTDDDRPDLSVLSGAARDVGRFLRAGALVVVESTVPPGTTLGVVAPILQDVSGLALGEDFFIGCCPERVMPGRLLRNMRSVGRVVGGMDEDVSRVMQSVYATTVEAEIELADVLTAEMVKVVENAYRDVQIGFANEVALVCAELGLDVWRVRELVNKVPYRDMHRPGGGVGGHCIPKDPWLLASVARRPMRIVPAARAVNSSMPRVIAETVRTILDVRNAESGRIAVLGLAYLPEADDVRNSPGLEFARHASELGLTPLLHDPYVTGLDGPLDQLLSTVELAVVMTPHRVYESLVTDVLVIDARHLSDAMRLAGLT